MSGMDLELDGRRVRVTREELEGDALRVTWGEVDGEAPATVVEAAVLGRGPGFVRLRVGDRTLRARVLRRGEDVWVAVGGESYRLPRARRGAGGAGVASDGQIEAPMPGALLEVLVEDGQEVEEGQDLVVVEAMKMEHKMKAPFAGTVRGLTASAGDRVEPGNPILTVVPADQG